MKTRKCLILFCLILWAISPLYAYVERNLLQQTVDLAKLESELLVNQEWVLYPDYTDRAGWDKFSG